MSGWTGPAPAVVASDDTMDARRTLVTGAGSGIGRATAVRLAREGGRVALLGRRRAALEETSALCRAAGGEGLVVPADVTREADVEAAAKAVRGAWGALEGLVSCAGLARYAAVEATSLDAWDEILRVNLTGPFLVTRAALPLLASGHRPAAVYVASTLALRGLRNAAAYCAAKAGLVNFARSLAIEQAPHGLRVNVVCPGGVDTAMLDTDRGDGLSRAERAARLARTHPVGRLAEPGEIADVIAWLLGGGASFVTGAVITADGGQTAGFER